MARFYPSQGQHPPAQRRRAAPGLLYFASCEWLDQCVRHPRWPTLSLRHTSQINPNQDTAMDVRHSPADEAFRLEVRHWFKDNLPRSMQRNPACADRHQKSVRRQTERIR